MTPFPPPVTGMAAVPVVWVHDDAALADAAFALTKLRTQPVSTSAPVKKSSKNSGGSVRSGELSPTTPALETTHSPFQPPAGAAPSGPRDTTPLLEVAADEVDLPMSEEDEGPRHGDGDGAGAYGCAFLASPRTGCADSNEILSESGTRGSFPCAYGPFARSALTHRADCGGITQTAARRALRGNRPHLNPPPHPRRSGGDEAGRERRMTRSADSSPSTASASGACEAGLLGHPFGNRSQLTLSQRQPPPVG